jgi:hypothetical protein
VRARLVVADASVDKNGVMRRLDDIRLKAEDQRIVSVKRLRLFQPRAIFSQEFARHFGKQVQRRQETGLLLDDPVDRKIGNGELQAHGALQTLCSRRQRHLH